VDEKGTVLKRIWDKKYVPIIGAALLGLMLLIGGGITGGGKKSDGIDDADSYFSVRFYTEDLEERIEELCRQIHGIGEVHVLVTLEGGCEYVYAENMAGGSHSYLLTSDGEGESPVFVQQIYPRIRGVAVVCTKGNDSTVRLAVTQLLSAAFDIPSSRIYVAGT
jgi:stage III sporulation protein AG